MSNFHNIYINTNSDRKQLGKCKYGYVNGNEQNLANRLSDSKEQFSDISKFIYIFRFEKSEIYNDDYIIIDHLISYGCRNKEIIEFLEMKYKTTLPYMRELFQYLIDGTNKFNEFIKDEGIPILINVLKRDFPKIGLRLTKEYSPKEINKINDTGRINAKNDYEENRNKYKTIMKLHQLQKTPALIEWSKRPYQQTIIELGTLHLRKYHRFYFELATGGGKSYIVYKLLDVISSDTIIIFSPRKKINEQNRNTKYISILNNIYRVFNYSKDTNIVDWLYRYINDKKIIVACIQSQEKIYDIIIDHNITNISIWFDEAHWSVEQWVDYKNNRSKQFFINDTNRIKKRIFTSASPDNYKVDLHPNVFGKLCRTIKVKELIGLKWLCPIKPRILEYDTQTLNLSDWIINEFTRTDSHFGFSFHSRDNNAFQLFYDHYQSYIEETTVRPYLLINHEGLSDENIKKLENIDLNYDFRNDEDFEYKENSIGYVCKRYDMGYDFDKLDYLVFSDPKMSRKDIIQCIGRGVRPDGLGENGKNMNKVLNIMLPVYIENYEGSYKNIIEVLRYLILDLSVDILEGFIRRGMGVSSFSDKKGKDVEYVGEENKSVLLDLIYQHNILERPTTKILYRFCRKYDITTEEEYNRFKLLNSSIPLKDNIYEYNGFKWKNVIDPEGKKYYREESEIENAEDQIISKIYDEEELEEFSAERAENGWIPLNRYDPKIPPIKIGELEHYY